MNHIGKYFINNRDEKLFYQCWEDSSKSYNTILILIHGLCLHSGCYPNLVNNLIANDTKVYALDLPGFGKSIGKKGDIDDFSKYIDDLESFRRLIKGIEGYREIIYLGHSLGANVALAYSIRYPENIVRTILASPILASPLFESIKKNNSMLEISHDYFASEQERIDTLKNDKLVLKSVSSRLLNLVKEAAEKAKENDLTKLKLLFLTGEFDKISTQEAVENFYNVIKCENKQIKSFPRMLHDIFSEKRSDQVFDAINLWISETKFEYKVK
jgi:alpha-beta hydrolase superfamily lysophospholipase